MTWGDLVWMLLIFAPGVLIALIFAAFLARYLWVERRKQAEVEWLERIPVREHVTKW